MDIEIGGIHSGISQSEENHIFPFFEIRLHLIRRLVMIGFQHLRVLGHRHSHRNQCFFIQFLISPLHDLISHTGLNLFPRHSDNLILLYQSQSL